MSNVANTRPLATLLAILLLGTIYRALALHWSGLNLYVDEAQYWTWSQALDWGYYSKPPVIAVIIAFTSALFGDGELAVKSGALLLYPLTTLLIYALAQQLFDRHTAFWSALVFFTLPGVAFSSMIISTDVPLFLCWTLAAYALLRATESNDWHWWLLMGTACGVGLLTKYTMGIFAISALLYVALVPRLRHHLASPRPYLAALLAALIFAPNLWWNAHHGWPTFHHTADISNLEDGAHFHFGELRDFLFGQAAIIGPVLFAALVVLVWTLRKGLGDERQRFLFSLTLPFLLVISLQALFGRANANWGAMTYSTGSIWLVASLLPRRRGVLIAAIAINLLAMTLAYHYHALTRLAGIELTTKSDFYKRVQGWDVLGTQVRLLLREHPHNHLLANERDTISELRYYARPDSNDAVVWNPDGQVISHYHLVTHMEGRGNQNFIFVTRDRVLPPLMADSFIAVQALPDLHVAVVPGWSLDYHVWQLTGFIGYPMRSKQ